MFNIGDNKPLTTGSFKKDPSSYNRQILIQTPTTSYAVDADASGNSLEYMVGSGLFGFDECGRHAYQGRIYASDLSYQNYGNIEHFTVHRNI